MAQYRIQVTDGPIIMAEERTKLVLALENGGVDVSHRCGGIARCTTCRVAIEGDEPPMGDPERACLVEDEVLGQFRLSCQIRVDRDMEVDVLMPVSSATWDNPGGDVEP